MSFGTNDISSIINCSNNETTLENNEENNNDDIVNQILHELGDQEEQEEYNDIKMNNMEFNNTELTNTELTNTEFNNIEFNNMGFDNIESNNIDLKNRKINNKELNSFNFSNNEQYNNNNLIFSNRLDDDIDFKKHIENKVINDEKKNNKNILDNNELDNNTDWLSLININNILTNIKLYKNYILILIISLITNNPIVYNQMSNISIFTTNNKLNIFAYIFQSILFITIYFIINIIILFI